MKRRAMREEQESKAKGYPASGGMHPPRWHPRHRLMDWPDCWLDLSCSACGSVVTYACRSMAQKHGNRTFSEILPRLKCQRCRKPPAEIHLVAGHHRKFCGGPQPDWSLPLPLH